MDSYYGTGQEWTHREAMEVEMDEPPVLLGKDEGLNPVEVLLSSLSGCMTTTLAYYAASLGLNMSKIESSFEGDIDLNGFLGINPEVRKGYQEIRVKFRYDGDATPEQVRELVQNSPVFDSISKPVSIKIEVEKS